MVGRLFLTAPLIAFATALLLVSPIHAEPLEHCEGKYAQAAFLVEETLAKYSTLYSGGLHKHRLDTVGHTLDLWRLWRGLPDTALREAEERSGYHNPSPALPLETLHNPEFDLLWSKARWAITPETSSDPLRRLWAAWSFDALTSVGPGIDWWRRVLDSDDLTDMQRAVATKAKTEPALDWMQSALAASNAPWANHWHRSFGSDPLVVKGHRNLSNANLARYEAGDGIEWLVTAALNNPDRLGTSYVDAALDALGSTIKTCTATPAGYAAYAVAIDTRGRATARQWPDWRRAPPAPVPNDLAPLPASILRRIATDRLYLATIAGMTSRRETDLDPFRTVLPNDAKWQSDVDLAHLYFADTLNAVPVSNNGYARRAYNLLSADDLLTLGRRADDAALISTAFARHVALENWAKAETILPDLQTMRPDDAALIDEYAALHEPLSIRLALIALHLPLLSNVITGRDEDVALRLWNNHLEGYRWDGKPVFHTRNLPASYGTGAFVQRDFETWLRLPQQQRAFSGMRGTLLPWMERNWQRNGWEPHPVHVPTLLDRAPFRHLIATEELTRLSGDSRFLHTLARTILPWAAAKTNTWAERRMRGLETESEALARLIRLCRHDTCGTWNRALAQDRAYRLLVGRMGDTDAAKRTTRWWKSVPR